MLQKQKLQPFPQRIFRRIKDNDGSNLAEFHSLYMRTVNETEKR